MPSWFVSGSRHFHCHCVISFHVFSHNMRALSSWEILFIAFGGDLCRVRLNTSWYIYIYESISTGFRKRQVYICHLSTVLWQFWSSVNGQALPLCLRPSPSILSAVGQLCISGMFRLVLCTHREKDVQHLQPGSTKVTCGRGLFSICHMWSGYEELIVNNAGNSVRRDLEEPS